MSTRLRRSICVFTSAVLLVGLNGCRHKDCRSPSCRIGSQYESTYDHPATTYEYYGPGPGPVLPPSAPGVSESELPPPVPESELAPRPSAGLIQPNTIAPVVPPAPLPSAIFPEPTAPSVTEPAAEDSPFKGALRSTREKVSRLFRTPHTSSGRPPAHRSSPAASSVRPFTSFPRQAAGPSVRMSPQPIAPRPAPQPVPGPVATVHATRRAAQTSWSEKERVTDDFVSPWTNAGESAADQESLDLADADSADTDGLETESIEIPQWPSVATRHPVTARAEQATREATSPQPIPVGTWVRITPRVPAEDDRDTTEVNAGAGDIPEPKRLKSSGPSLVPPQSK